MDTQNHAARASRFSPLRDDGDVLLPAAAFLRYGERCDGWTAGRQAACLAHLADHGVVVDAVRAVGMSTGGAYAFRRKMRGYAFNLGWEAALLVARRIVADQLMTAAIKGEEARWVREDGTTTYTRQNTKLSLTLLDRVTQVESLNEVLAVVARFDWFLRLIASGTSAQDLWVMFFDAAIPRHDIDARERVRAGLLLSDESAAFGEEDEQENKDGWNAGEADDTAPIEYKSMVGPTHECRCEAHDIPPFPPPAIPPMALLWLISISNHSNPNAAAYGPRQGLKACLKIRRNGCASTLSMLTSRRIRPSQSLGQKRRQRSPFNLYPIKFPCRMNLLAV